MRKMALSLKMGGEWIPGVNEKSGRLKLGGPVLIIKSFKEMKLNAAREGDVSRF